MKTTQQQSFKVIFKMLEGFKQFVLRGNVIDLAVGIVIGSAFNSVVNALVKDILSPLIAAIGGTPDFSALSFSLNGSVLRYGDFVNSLISFLVTAAAVYFVVILPLKRINGLVGKKETKPTTEKCPYCLSEIPKGASRCAYCTANLSKLITKKR